jgi:dolichol-phosphate mannosyltransferase
MYYDNNWAIVTPMANESSEFDLFISEVQQMFDRLQSGRMYIVIDKSSKDNTLDLAKALAVKDERFVVIFAPENKNVVDAYIRGYQEAFKNNHDIIIEMDAGMSHDPKALPMFLRVLNEGNECAFGSRFINGGSMVDSPPFRRFLSRGGTFLANTLLGTSLYDMTSGYQGFHRSIVERILNYHLASRAHFYQTELRYLLRNTKFAEVPIHYKAPSPNVSKKAIYNSFSVLFSLFTHRLRFKALSI